MTNHATRHAPLVLTGFMGTGKTTVGKLVAEKLSRELVDMDLAIEAREGMTVHALFAAPGEEYFRARESGLCLELAQRGNLVVATGGGTLVDPRNRAAFAGALVVCLDATADAVCARVKDAGDRPLLGVGARERIESLMAARREAYAQIAFHVDTTNKTVDQVADEVVAWLERTKTEERIAVKTLDMAYSVDVGAGLLARVGARVAALDSFSRRCAVVTNACVGSIYASQVTDSLRAAGFAPSVIEIRDGEKFKTLDTAREIYDQLIDAQLDRRSIIFALGGGVVGDVAGFAAATFLRGVPFVQLPTTLLAMVDASIGGKVAVDHPRGKNLIGAFKPPCAVIADTNALATLPAAEWRAGMAEVVKHAIIGDAGLFEMLEVGNWKFDPSTSLRASVGSWIVRAIQVKVDIVTRDPFEHGERAQLNLGHTFAHALEKLSGYELRHGDAVAIGLMGAARLAARRGTCPRALVERIETLLGALGLPTRVPRARSAAALVDAMQTDKKRADGALRFVLPRALGDVVSVDDVTRGEIVAAIEETRE
ncbi:MAG TPA: 3-dehydroquinate synthase [Anaerolineae bacterium]